MSIGLRRFELRRSEIVELRTLRSSGAEEFVFGNMAYKHLAALRPGHGSSKKKRGP